jgi:hypothetical protein
MPLLEVVQPACRVAKALWHIVLRAYLLGLLTDDLFCQRHVTALHLAKPDVQRLLHLCMLRFP